MDPWMLFQKEADKIGISFTQRQLEQLEQYASLLVEWNQKMNLTTITTLEGIVIKHFLDSIYLLRFLPIHAQTSFMDVGTGAGFPALPLAVAVPGLKPFLLDSLQKRLIFLQAVCKALGIEAVFLHQRAEDAGKMRNLRANFQVVAARAVAPLPVLCEYCLPLVKTGSVFAALKGPDGPAEVEAASSAIQKLGGKVQALQTYSLCDAGGRSVIIIEKMRDCAAQYPRSTAKLKKEPL